MTKMLNAVLASEKETILEWIDEAEEGEVYVQLTQFKWKQFTIEFEHDCKYNTISADGDKKEFESWEDALDYVMNETIRTVKEKIK